MGVQVEIKQQNTTMIRVVNGKLVKEERAANIYIVPPKGEYEFEVTGYALPFEMKKDPQYVKEGESEYQTMTRVEFTITEGKGKGRMFDQMWGFAIGPQSNLGRFCRLMNIPIPRTGGFDLDQIIGYQGKGYLVPSEKLDDDNKPKYTKLSLDTVEGTHPRSQEYTFDGDLSEASSAQSNGHSESASAASSDDGWPAD